MAVRRGRVHVAAAATLAGLAIAAVLALPGPAGAARTEPRPDATAWILIDAETGDVLAARRAERSVPIASATKLMTAYVALRKLPLSKRVKAPPYAPLPVESVLGLQAGEQIKVRDLIYALVLASANDGAVAIAEAASGSVPAFVVEMNRMTDVLGLEDTSFANPIGLDAEGNASSARDLATLARLLLAEPVFRRIADSERRTIVTDRATRTISTRNALLERKRWITGVKTGHTLGAGHVLVGAGSRRGVTLISVVLGAPSEQARDQGTLKLLRYGFSRYPREPAPEEGETASVAEASESVDAAESRPSQLWPVIALFAIVILIAFALTRRAKAGAARERQPRQ